MVRKLCLWPYPDLSSIHKSRTPPLAIVASQTIICVLEQHCPWLSSEQVDHDVENALSPVATNLHTYRSVTAAVLVVVLATVMATVLATVLAMVLAAVTSTEDMKSSTRCV